MIFVYSIAVQSKDVIAASSEIPGKDKKLRPYTVHIYGRCKVFFILIMALLTRRNFSADFNFVIMGRLYTFG